MTAAGDGIPPIFYHGTRADLKPGDPIEAGFSSNYGERRTASWVYLTATLDAAIWGAELAAGEGRERIYIVEPTGPIVDDPNLTDRKYPGNPTRSYRSRDPLRVTGDWTVRRGIPFDIEGHRPLLRRIAWICIPAGLPLSLLSASRLAGFPAEGAMRGVVSAAAVSRLWLAPLPVRPGRVALADSEPRHPPAAGEGAPGAGRGVRPQAGLARRRDGA